MACVLNTSMIFLSGFGDGIPSHLSFIPSLLVIHIIIAYTIKSGGNKYYELTKTSYKI